MKTINLFVFLLVITNVNIAVGQDKKADAKKIDTVKLEQKKVESYETLEGVLESDKMIEIRTNFNEWSDLKVKHVAKQGTEAKEGALLLNFDTESIEKAIVDAKFEYQTAFLAHKDAELAAEEDEKISGMEKDIAERKWIDAQADYAYYKQVTVPQREKDLEYTEKSASYSLEYSKDELDQLEQMYKEDDLTEESEEIVLKRAQRSVEAAERSMERVLRTIKRQKELDNPRKDKEMEDTLKRQQVEFEKSKVELEVKSERAKIALKKAEVDLENKQKKVEELIKDQGKMSISSPASGIVYYGECVNGKWVGPTGTAARDIKVGAKLLRDKVAMTLVDPSSMIVRAALSEEQLSEFKTGMQGNALITANKVRAPVTIKSISNVPNVGGKYDCELEIGKNAGESNSMPGMTCKMSFRTFYDENATVAPKASVFSDDGGVTHYVYVVKDNQSEKRFVEVGPVSGTDIVILEGVTGVSEIAKMK